ncbi:DNA damage binding protein 1 [Paragonimus heterotremus]|uniref:DNA damage binding protein 1 n=1 Tax=Paragonimus heterotremus TaxID=100268 RepID=A0A8J4TA46_9TREM|nr:DNA damage binding protein 1 [Paragonimus heterotremus]
MSFQAQNSLFILTHKAGVALIECVRNNDIVEFVTVASGSVEDRGARIIDQGFDVLVDPGANYVVVRLYHGLLKIILLHCIGDKIGTDLLDTNQWTVNTYNVRLVLQIPNIFRRIEEGNIVDMVFLYGYSLPTFAMIYEDELVLHMKTYEISGREPALRNVQLTLDSIEPDSKLLIPVPKPYGGVILVGDNIIYYHTKDGPHISQYIPQAKASQVLCYAAVDSQRYLLGDMAGRLYMVHLLSEESSSVGNSHFGAAGSASLSVPRIGSIRIELLGETTTPESIAYLDNGVVFIGSTLGDSQLIRLSPDPDPERNSYLSVLENYTNIGPIVDMVLLETKGQNQLITCSGAFKEGALRIIRNGIGIHEHATIDQDLIKGTWCFPLDSDRFDDTIVVSMVGQTQLLRLADDDITALRLEGFKTDEQTVYCATLSPSNVVTDASRPETTQHSLLLQATTSGIRLIGIRNLKRGGCLGEWHPPSGRGISCLSSWGSLIVIASGTELYTLHVVGSINQPVFEQIAYRTMPHEVACVDLTPFDHKRAALSLNQPLIEHEVDYSVPQLVAVGLWLGHGLALLKLPGLELVHEEPLPEITASTGTALLPRSVLMAQLEDTAYLFAAMGDGTLYFYTIVPTADRVFLRDAKRVNAGTGPSMFLRQWRSQCKVNVFVCSNHPCVVYSIKNKLIFANLNLKEVNFMTPLNGAFYNDCIALVTPNALIIGSVDEIQKLHVRTLSLEETPKRLALQQETGTLGVLTYRQEVFQDGVGFKPVRSSISLSPKVPKSTSRLPKTVPSSVSATERKFREIEVSSLLIFNQSNMELMFAHSFYSSQTLVEVAVSIASIGSTDDHKGVLYAVGTAFMVEEEVEPSKGRIHLFHWDSETSRLETVMVHDVNGSVYRIVDFNGRLLTAINSSVRLFDIKEDSLRLACSFNENILVLFLRRKGDFVLAGDLMRSLTLLLFRPNVNNFEAIGRHRSPRWTTCIEILDDEHFLAAEVENNLFVVSRDSPENTQEPSVRALLAPSAGDPCVLPSSVSLPSKTSDSALNKRIGKVSTSTGQTTATGDPSAATTEPVGSTSSAVDGQGQGATTRPSSSVANSNTESTGTTVSGEVQRLADCAYMHTGDFINVIVKGNLVIQNNEERWPAIANPTHLYGTVSGSLGLVIQISPVLFAFLKEIQSRLEKLVIPVGGFAHDMWRAFKADRVVLMAKNFVDGDLIETVLDLGAEDKAKLVRGLRVPVNMDEFGVAGSACLTDPETRDCTVVDLVKVVEEMARLH